MNLAMISRISLKARSSRFIKLYIHQKSYNKSTSDIRNTSQLFHDQKSNLIRHELEHKPYNNIKNVDIIRHASQLEQSTRHLKLLNIKNFIENLTIYLNEYLKNSMMGYHNFGIIKLLKNNIFGQTISKTQDMINKTSTMGYHQHFRSLKLLNTDEFSKNLSKNSIINLQLSPKTTSMKLLNNKVLGQRMFKTIEITQKTSTVRYYQYFGSSNVANKNNCSQNGSKNLKISTNTSILGNQEQICLNGHQMGSLNLLNHNNFGQIISRNVNIQPKTSILGHQQQRFLNGHQMRFLNLLNHNNFGQILSKNVKLHQPKTSILGHQQQKFLNGHQMGSLNMINHFGQTFSENVNIQQKTSLLGHQHHRFLHGHQMGSLNLLNHKNFGQAFTNLKIQPKPSTLLHQPCRFMKLLEYQGAEVLQASGIPTGKFAVVKNADEAEKMARDLQATDFMVKAQVLTGGRGKGKFKNSKISGVKMATSAEEVGKICKLMLGDHLVTKQTRADGIVCNAVLVAERHFPRKEFYFAITMDRAFDGPVVIASTQGGMDIEEVAIVDPSAVLYEPIDVMTGLKQEQALEITKKLKIVETPEKLAEILINLYKIFEKDAILVELNPLALDIHNNYLCLDCKMQFDDSASFRQPELFKNKNISQLDSRELSALQQNINYIALNGNIGCMVNGAGLAMATMDIIQLHGGEPANFLDVGGGATVKTVETCFEIITSDKNVDCIFVNIFGGIMRCDIIAQGIVTAAQKLELKQLPIVCRLRGTNVAEAKAIIAASEMKILSIDDLDEGAKVAVKVSKIRQFAKEAHLDVNFELLGI